MLTKTEGQGVRASEEERDGWGGEQHRQARCLYITCSPLFTTANTEPVLLLTDSMVNRYHCQVLGGCRAAHVGVKSRADMAVQTQHHAWSRAATTSYHCWLAGPPAEPSQLPDSACQGA